MIQYNPKEWFKLIFTFRNGDTLKILFPLMMVIGLYTGVICFIMLEVLDFKYKSTPVFHSLIGFIISMLLVFRTNTAYERWSDGRKHWGSLVNLSRSVSSKLKTMIGHKDMETYKYLNMLMADYPFALKEHLRKTSDGTHIIMMGELESYQLLSEAYDNVDHKPNYIANLIFVKIHELYVKKVIDSEEFAMFRMDINSYFDVCGACERIRNTPIPFSYSTFIKKFIFIYTATMPFGFLTEFQYITIPVVMLVFYALTSLELIAEEIEDPFGLDENDLPTQKISETIRANLKEIELLN